MPLLYQKMIYRSDLKANPKIYYVFGDNKMRVGYGGQAREMRGELNAIGVITKKDPSLYLNDAIDYEWYDEYLHSDDGDLAKIWKLLSNNEIVVFPALGIGTGLANMEFKAPRCWNQLQKYLKAIEVKYGQV